MRPMTLFYLVVAACAVVFLIYVFPGLNNSLNHKEELSKICNWQSQGIIDKEYFCVDENGKILSHIWKRLSGEWEIIGAGENSDRFIDADSAKKAVERYLIKQKEENANEKQTK
jgi:hypothetical protein